MRLANIKKISPGMVLSREVITAKNVVLLARGTCLTQEQLARLKAWGIMFVHINEKPENRVQQPAGMSSMTKADFIEEYLKISIQIKNAFRRIKYFNEVPVLQMQELINQRILPLIEVQDALTYLYEMRLYSEYTFQHSLNVAVIAGILGKWRAYKGIKLKNLILAGLLHDIGKVEVPLSIINKPGKLSFDEFDIIKQHSWEGYRLIKDSGIISDDSKKGILQHHERIDGSGYPWGLEGTKIHDYAKIIAVADTYDAITSDRAYRSRLTPFVALEAIAGEMYRKLETSVCLTFLDNTREYFTGSKVLLSNGEMAKIIAFDGIDRRWTKPVVRLKNGTMLDLQEEEVNIVALVEAQEKIV